MSSLVSRNTCAKFQPNPPGTTPATDPLTLKTCVLVVVVVLVVVLGRFEMRIKSRLYVKSFRSKRFWGFSGRNRTILRSVLSYDASSSKHLGLEDPDDGPFSLGATEWVKTSCFGGNRMSCFQI